MLSHQFLPYLVRDTIAVLRLKGYEPSAASLALPQAPPESQWVMESNGSGDLVSSVKSTELSLVGLLVAGLLLNNCNSLDNYGMLCDSFSLY